MIQLVTNGNRYEELKLNVLTQNDTPLSVSFGTYTMNIDLRDFNNVDLMKLSIPIPTRCKISTG